METVLTNTRTKLDTSKGGKLGKCLICSKRVRKSKDYITASEGYAHKNCLKEWRNTSE